MADPFKEAMGRAMEPEPKEEAGGAAAGGKGGEVHSMHHFNGGGGKHHVVKHHSGGVEHSEHGAGEQEETCPLCGGTGEAPEK